MSIAVQQLSYVHPDKEVLFQHISFSVQQGQKLALIGNNGSGKSTLIQLIAGQLSPSSGEVICSSVPYYIPQHFGQYNNLTVAEALHIDKKLQALQAILQGDASEGNFTVLADDWDIEERAQAALLFWGVEHIKPSQIMSTLSGGEKTKVFLAGINLHAPQIILMDEPTNYLDYKSRNRLYDFIGSVDATVLVISHDRSLLNLLPSIYELSKSSITYYGGNYEFYKEQKELEINALFSKLDEQEKQLRLARKTARETIERKQKQNVRGEKLSQKKGVGKMEMDRLKSKSDKSTSKLKDVHDEKMESISENLADIRSSLPDLKLMKVDLNASQLHKGKQLVVAKKINYGYNKDAFLWKEPLDFLIKSGDRVVIEGGNGSGKTTLIKIITGLLMPTEGTVTAAEFKYVYLDQEYSLVKNYLSIYEQARSFNAEMQEHEIKIILNRFLFPPDSWDKPCEKLSGGEKMRLSLCCLVLSASAPDMLILDEPTNNIDIRNIEILTEVVKEYRGTLLVVSHDRYFLDQIGIDYSIALG